MSAVDRRVTGVNRRLSAVDGRMSGVDRRRTPVRPGLGGGRGHLGASRQAHPAASKSRQGRRRLLRDGRSPMGPRVPGMRYYAALSLWTLDGCDRRATAGHSRRRTSDRPLHVTRMRIPMGSRTPLLPSALLTCCVLLGACTAASLAQPSKSSCVHFSELAFDGIPITANGQFVREKLGKPLKEEVGQSEDDSGSYDVVHLAYPEMLVDLGRGGDVESLFTKSKRVALPLGVRIGMSREQVLAKWPLEDQPPQPKPSHRSVAVCEEPDEVQVLEFFVAFDAHGRLAEAEINLYGP
jgi:hypothetical protein